eukprot:11449404-Prorocentrum_lima.AAC.1
MSEVWEDGVAPRHQGVEWTQHLALLSYSDDLFLLGHSPGEIQGMVTDLEEGLGKWNLPLKGSKSQWA